MKKNQLLYVRPDAELCQDLLLSMLCNSDLSSSAEDLSGFTDFSGTWE